MNRDTSAHNNKTKGRETFGPTQDGQSSAASGNPILENFDAKNQAISGPLSVRLGDRSRSLFKTIVRGWHRSVSSWRLSDDAKVVLIVFVLPVALGLSVLWAGLTLGTLLSNSSKAIASYPASVLGRRFSEVQIPALALVSLYFAFITARLFRQFTAGLERVRTHHESSPIQPRYAETSENLPKRRRSDRVLQHV